MSVNLASIEEDVKILFDDGVSQEEFIYQFLGCYGLPKASITRLKAGTYNLAKEPGMVLWKKKLCFKVSDGQEMLAEIDALASDASILKHAPRFVVLTDYQTLLAVDTKTKETLETPFQELVKHYAFFLPWAGMEKSQAKLENPADVKAAERMARLYDEIVRQNPILNQPEPPKEVLHELNVFLARLLFCFFAEDTKIFGDDRQGIFTRTLADHSQADGSDLKTILERLFEVMNLPEDAPGRKDLPAWLAAFPYVNGGLFKDRIAAPVFSQKARKLIIESGQLDWSAINPDIFGSMMQAVVHTSQRGNLGMHYTSVPNIMKVIEPLFLDELREELDKARGNLKQLQKLQARLCKLRIFDPACGSGNFLIIAYKELRALEMEVFDAMQEASGQAKLAVPMSGIALTQFYGIEIDDFAHEIAILALWLAEHQMNVQFEERFGQAPDPLPLTEAGRIVCGNATRLDWKAVCPNDEAEVFVLGNPPYLGSRNQDPGHKSDLEFLFGDGYKSLDYISAWFFKAAKYIKTKQSFAAFVSTNSIAQGEQVGLIWPKILTGQVEIGFAHQSFKWTNNAKRNAGVTCVIVGLRNISSKDKYIFSSGVRSQAKQINPYLVDGKSCFLLRRQRSLNPQLPNMTYGSLLNDKGFLTFESESDKQFFIQKNPAAAKYIKRLIGSQEFIKGFERFCLLIDDDEVEEAKNIEDIKLRLDKVREHRENSSEASTVKMALKPNRFYFSCYKPTTAIIVPRTSSERREYIPIGFVEPGSVITDAANAVYDAEPYLFALLTSKMHMAWVRAVAGRLKTDYRYSATLCYNTFPVPPLSERQKETLASHTFNVLEEREKHPEKTMAELYDPEKMPNGLREAHHYLDLAVDKLYRSRPFTSDEERLETLFKLYEEMIAEEQAAAKGAPVGTAR